MHKRIRNESVPIVPLARTAHSAGSLGWSFPVLKYKYIFFQIKYTETILSNSSRKLLWFEITKMLIAVQKHNLLCFYYKFRHTFVPYWLPGGSVAEWLPTQAQKGLGSNRSRDAVG